MHEGEGMAEEEGTVIFSGDDKHAPLTLLCGNCSAPLAKRVYSGQISNVVFEVQRLRQLQRNDHLRQGPPPPPAPRR